jgi:cytochrome c oxidase cbb3-type subunit 3
VTYLAGDIVAILARAGRILALRSGGWLGIVLALLVLGAAGTAMAVAIDRQRMRDVLVSSFADELPPDPALRAYAQDLAEPAYAAQCAGCHGAVRDGAPARGVPDLRRGVWLYDFGRISDLERTILYGIRSGHGKGRNTADMPALGATGQLAPDEIRDVAAYVISQSRRGGDAAAITRGERIYQGKGQCFDCHGADAAGNIDWGTPGFTAGNWLYGGDPETVYASIHDGRHGRCPAWIGVLDPATIRALAIFLHDAASGGAQG